MNRSETLKARIPLRKTGLRHLCQKQLPQPGGNAGVGGVRLCHSGLRALQLQLWGAGEYDPGVPAGRPGLHSPHRLPGALAGPSRPGERSHRRTDPQHPFGGERRGVRAGGRLLPRAARAAPIRPCGRDSTAAGPGRRAIWRPRRRVLCAWCRWSPWLWPPLWRNCAASPRSTCSLWARAT